MKKLLLVVGVATMVVGCGDKSASKAAKEVTISSDQKLYSYFSKCYPSMELLADAKKGTGASDTQLMADSASAFRLAAFSSGEKLGLSMGKVDAELLSGFTTLRKPFEDFASKSPAEQEELKANFKKESDQCAETLKADPEILAAFNTAYAKAK